VAREPITLRAARLAGRYALAAAALGAGAVLLAAWWQRGGLNISQTVTGHIEAPVTQVIGSNNTVTAGPRVRRVEGDAGGPMSVRAYIASESPYPEGVDLAGIRWSPR